jgi:hypothetical protein
VTRAYIRLDPSFDERKESYPDGPYAALIATFCLAEHQPERGRFRSLDYLTRLLGKRGRHVKYLVDHGDLTLLEDRRAYVDGWDEWQEGDWKVAERVTRIRNRAKRTPPVTLRVTPTVTPAVTGMETVGVTLGRLSVSGGGSAGGAMSEARALQPAPSLDDDPEHEVRVWLANHGCEIRPGSGYDQRLVVAVAAHGVVPLIGMMDRLARAGTRNGDLKGFLFKAVDALDEQTRPNLSELKAEDQAERASESTRVQVERTKRHLHDIGHHQDNPDPLCPACKEASVPA